MIDQPRATDDFDWRDDDSVVVNEQPETAVYLNRRGQVVIRQRGPYPDDDVFVIFNPEHICTLILALEQAIEHRL